MASYSPFNVVDPSISLGVSTGMTFDLSGNYLYMASGNSINKFDASGIPQLVVTNTNSSTFQGLAFDTYGFLYACLYPVNRFTSTDSSIVKIDISGGIITPFADGTASGSDISLSFPEGLAFDDYGNLYCACSFNNGTLPGVGYIAKINTSGVVTKFADGGAPNSDISLNETYGLTVDNKKKYLYCSNVIGNYIAKIDISGGVVTKFADGSAQGSDASLNTPIGLVFDNYGNLYCANVTGNSIVQISGNGVVTNFVYPSTNPYTTRGIAINNNFLYFNGNYGSNGIVYRTNDPLLSFSALIQNANLIKVLGLTYDTSGNIYCSNTFLNNQGNITVYDSLGKYKQTIQKYGSNGYSLFSSPQGLAFDDSGNLYCANSGGNNILKITSPSTTSYDVNSVYSLPLDIIKYPVDIAYYSGYLYYVGFLSSTDSLIGKLDLSLNTFGQCTQVASYISRPNQGQDFSLNTPTGVTCDICGNVYVANPALNNHKFSISKFDVCLNYLTSYISPDLNVPFRLAFDNSGNLMIANSGADNVLQLDTSTGFFTVFADVDFSLSALSVNKDDYLYLADYTTYSGTIYTTDEPVCFNHDTKILYLNSLLEEEYIPIQDLHP